MKPAALLRFSLVLVFLLLSCMTQAASTPAWTSTYNKLLAKYITPRGVKYAAWKSNAADLKALQEVVDGIAQEKVSGLNKNEQLAFYINAYNAWILHEALEKYPTKSVKDLLFTFFLSKRLTVAGEKMSFNDLEKDVIRKKFNEPRIHFALNCASQSCPPLNQEAFRGDKLDAQLAKLSVAFINSPRGVNYVPQKKTAALSAIFNWYKDDFKAVGGPLVFINQRHQPPLPNDVKITYQDYDWGLNEVK